MRRLPELIATLVLAVAAIAIYWDARDNEFVWDDPIVFQRQLPYFEGADNVGNIFFPPDRIPQFSESYYRPLIIVTYLVDEGLAATLWPEDAREEARRITYHVSVIVYHAVATVLVFWLGLALASTVGVPRGDPRALGASLAGALLFAAHPIHVESVAWMAGRSDVVCGIFFLAATITLLHFARRRRLSWLIGTAALFAGAMFSKEAGVGFLILAPVVLALVKPDPGAAGRGTETLTRAQRRRRERDQRAGRARGSKTVSLVVTAAVLLATAGGYFLVRNAAIEGMTNAAERQMRAQIRASSPGRIATVVSSTPELLGALSYYTVKTVWPPPQSAFVAKIPTGAGAVALGALVLVGIAGLVFVAYKRRDAGAASPKLEALCAALFLATLAPSLAIAVFSISETPLAERYVYIPSAGACLLAGFLLARLARLAAFVPERARVALPVAVAAVIAIPATMATAERVRVWSSDLAFWEDTVKKAPDQGLPFLHLGIAKSRLDDFDAALEAYLRAYEQYDDAEGRSKAMNNAASILLRTGRFEQAIEYCKRALDEVREYPTPHYNWALALLQIYRDAPPERRPQILEDVERHLRTAIRYNPRYVKAHYQLGRLLVNVGERDAGREHLERTIRLARTSPEARSAAQLLERISGGR